jgi:hypothetical protein
MAFKTTDALMEHLTEPHSFHQQQHGAADLDPTLNSNAAWSAAPAAMVAVAIAAPLIMCARMRKRQRPSLNEAMSKQASYVSDTPTPSPLNTGALQANRSRQNWSTNELDQVSSNTQYAVALRLELCRRLNC